MATLSQLLKDIVIQLLQYLKDRLTKILFILEHLIGGLVLLVLFGYLNAILFEIMPFSEIWWDPVASGYALLIGLIRGFWHNAIETPGTLLFHIRVVTHCYLATAPASAILVTIFSTIALMQSWFFIRGFFSDDPNDLRFFHFLNKNRLPLFALLFTVICIIGYFLSYNPILPGACSKGNKCGEGLKSISEPLSLFIDNLIFLYSSMSEPASPLMEKLIALHSDIWAIILFIVVFVLFSICSILYNFNASNAMISSNANKKNLIKQLLTLIFTAIPAIILCSIAIPYFTLLYKLDEIIEPSLTVKTIGREWDWDYEYGDYASCDGKTTNNLGNNCENDGQIVHSMASPKEGSNGWFGSIKDWWSGQKNQALSPLETNQKTLGHLHKTQTVALDQCKQHDDILVDGSMTPRSKAIAIAKRDECFFHYNNLSKCVNNISLDVARTQYEPTPPNFASAFGNALGNRVGQVTEPIYVEMAKNAVIITADTLKSPSSNQ